MPPRIRLVIDKARPAAENMALDELFMEALRSPGAAPVLRFYSWSEPCVTVGYFQNPAEIGRRLEKAGKPMPVVRRITGGGMVVHGNDLTFSLALPTPNPYLPDEVKASYLKVNEAVMAGMKPLYPALDFVPCKDAPSARGAGDRACFENPSCYDLMDRGKKVVGASQRRREGRLLHQATLFFANAPKDTAARVIKGMREKWKAAFIETPLGVEEEEKGREAGKAKSASAEWCWRPKR